MGSPIDILAKGHAPPDLPMAKSPGDAFFTKLDAADQVLLTQLLREPIDYVDYEGFASPELEKQLFGAAASSLEGNSTRFRDDVRLPMDVSRGASRIPTLSYEQEQLMFLRYNYARWKVAQLLREFTDRRLTSMAARKLLAWGRRAGEMRGMITRFNMPLVMAMAKRTRLNSIDFNELISEGNMALLRSVEKFDCTRGYKFSTYSCRAILKSFSRVAMRASRYRGQFPTEYDSTLERSDYIDQKREGIEWDCVDELKEILISNLANLSDVERTVISERFAIGRRTADAVEPPKTLEQVGQLIGVTKERVRQIQNKALRKIRSTLEERFLAA